MTETTKISESSSATKQAIKDIAGEQIAAEVDVTVAAYDDLVANQEAIAILQSQINDPLPVEDTDVFQMQIADNTTVASVSLLLNTTFTHWQISESTSNPTVGWIACTVNTATYDLVDWDSHTKYMYVKEVQEK